MKDKIVKLAKMVEQNEGLTREQAFNKLAIVLDKNGSMITKDYISWVMENPN